jgi:ribosomal protein S18 acetylase RimI-like enzyme
MKPEDMPACRAVIAASWNKFTAQIAEPELGEMFNGGAWRPFFYVMEHESTPIAMAGYNTSWLTYGVYNLFWVATLPEHRNNGVASHLVEACLDDLRPIADAVMLVTGVPAFYRRWGFRVVGTIPTAESNTHPAGANFGDSLMMLSMSGVRAA